MEVEPVGVSASETPKQSKKSETGKSKVWFFVLCGLFVVIVGLVIAIVVVKNLPKGSEEVAVNEEITLTNDEAFVSYDNIKHEIDEKIFTKNEWTDEELWELYVPYIEDAKDDKVKALLKMNYYVSLVGRSSNLDNRDNILGKLIEADNEIQTSYSAYNVAYAAEYLQDDELSKQYYLISNERLGSKDE